MEAKEQEILSSYQERLVDQLQPNDVLKNLVAVASFNGDDFQAILRLNELPRQVQIESLLNTLKKHHNGLRNLVKSLLLSDKHDVLAREILGNEIFEEHDLDNLLQDLRDRLSEIQILKLELLKERKRHDSTKRELDEVKSNRNSMVFSDHDSSYCSGFDSSDTDTTGMTGYLLLELEEEKRRRVEAEYLKSCQEQEMFNLSQKNRELEESQSLLLRQFKSLGDISVVQDEISRRRFPWKAASVADLCLRDTCSNEGTLTKWRSDDSGAQLREYPRYNEGSGTNYHNTGILDLAEKVSNLEMQLAEEREKRLVSEHEMSQLETENKQLQFELDETRDQLLDMSQHDLTQESISLEDDIWDQDEYGDMDMASAEDYENIYNKSTLGRGFSCPALNLNDLQFRRSNTTSREQQRMRRPVSYHGDTDISGIWQNRNVEHYEMDEYEHEIEKKPDPRETDIKYVLRRLKLKTWNLYHDIVMGSAELKILGNRAEKLRSRCTYN